jgi:hypothetical protein
MFFLALPVSQWREEAIEAMTTSMPTPARIRRLLPTRDAAAYLSVSPWQLRNLVHTGQILVVQGVEGGPLSSGRARPGRLD